MKQLHKYIISLISVCIAFISVQAQKDSISTELNKTIKVYSEYKPQISDVVRISVNPQAYDTLDLTVNLNYSIESKPVATAYTIKPLKAVSVKGDKLAELYRGYAAVGFGNYSTSFLNIRYMTERSRNKQAGVEFYHLGSLGKVRFANDDKLPAGYTQDYINIYGKKFYDNFTGYASFKPTFNSVLKYGHQPYYNDLSGIVSDTTFNKKDIRKSFTIITTKAGIQSNGSEKTLLKYTSELEHNLTITNPKSTENLVTWNSSIKKQFDQIKTGADFNVFWSGVNFNPVAPVSTRNQAKIQLLPHVGTSVDDWSLRIGINVMQSIGISKFKAYPDVQFSYNLLNYSLIPYLNYSGNMEMYSLKEILLENPYVNDYTMLYPTNNKMNLEIGAQGRIARSIPFKYSCKITELENQYFWVNDANSTDTSYNSFAPVYDNGRKLTLHAETGLKRKYVGIDAAFDYNHYTLDNLTKPWHKPGIEASFAIKYNIISPLSNKTKLVATSQVFYEDLMYAQDIFGNAKKLDPIFDVNLHLDYYYNSVFVIFAHVNNITATKYQRYYLYPTQRTNFLLGVTYSFAGHKE